MRHSPPGAPLRPSIEELKRLYCDERLSAESIAQQCEVQKITVLRWLKSAGIPRRAARGLANRGVEPPTPEELFDMIHVQYLGYRGVAEKYGVDATAVPHWLKRHGISAPTIWGTRRKGEHPRLPSKDELRARLDNRESLRSIAGECGVSGGTIGSLCREYNLIAPQPGWQGGRTLLCADGHEVKSIYEQKVDNWLSRNGVAHSYEPRYSFDKRCRADFGVGDVMIEVWGVTNRPSYTERKERKISKCAEAGIPLIQIEHWQFYGGRRWWKPLEGLLS